MIRIIIADDHPLVLGAVRDLLVRRLPEVEIRSCATVGEVVDLVFLDAYEPDLVLLDLDMPGVDGMAGLTMLLDADPLLPVAIFSASRDASVVREALARGASGFLSKSLAPDDFVSAVEVMLEGGSFPGGELPRSCREDTAHAPTVEMDDRLATLTRQQLRILVRIVACKSNKLIAHELGLSEQTIKSYASAAYRKLGITTRTQAALILAKRPDILKRHS